MSARRWAYVATLVPIGVPVRLPTIKGTPALTTFHETTFQGERKNPTRIKVQVDHDRQLVVGELHRVYPVNGWWRVVFVFHPEITEEVQVGQAVSAGISEWKWGGISLDEVSIVREGAVRGAEVIERFELGPATRPAAAARPAAATRAAKGEEVSYGGPLLHRNIGQVTAIGGRPVRTRAGDPIRREVGGNIIIDRPDGSSVIYCGAEGRADFAREHGHDVRA